jgi:hypothetical protein
LHRVRVTTADDDQARERAHAIPGRRVPGNQGIGYLTERRGDRLDLEPRYCRCLRPAPIAEVDRQHGVVSVACPCRGRLRAELNQLDLRALAVVRRAQR